MDSFIFTLLSSGLKLKRLRYNHYTRSPALQGNPQLRGAVLKARIVTPKKPNSARRPVVKAVLSNRKSITAHIPGRGHNLRRHSSVLILGVGARDLPGVRYSCARGVLDFLGLLNKVRRRSVYGAPMPELKRKKIRRKFRNLM